MNNDYYSKKLLLVVDKLKQRANFRNPIRIVVRKSIGFMRVDPRSFLALGMKNLPFIIIVHPSILKAWRKGILNDKDLESLLAHELGHLKAFKLVILFLFMVNMMSLLASLIIEALFRVLVSTGKFTVYYITIWRMAFLLVISLMMLRACIRFSEFKADEEALIIVKREELIGSYERVKARSKELSLLMEEHPYTRVLKRIILRYLFGYPTLSERIQRLKRYRT